MDGASEHSCPPQRVPGAEHLALGDYCWFRNVVGESGGAVYRLDGKPNAPQLFVKHGVGTIAADVLADGVRLRWLRAHCPVPDVVHLTMADAEAWLVMTALSGRTAYALLEAGDGSQNAIVDALAEFLRRLHAIPPAQCPFDSRLADRLPMARARIDAGLVDEADFDDARLGWSAEQVWAALPERLPASQEAVVTHGDFSLDNVLIADGKVTGCIDVGRSGLADRYQDVAIMWNCLGGFDPALRDRFLTRYGASPIDWKRLELHLLLDELF